MLRCHASLFVAVVALAIAGCGSGGSPSGNGGQSEMDRMAQELEQESAAKQRAAADAEAAKQAAAQTPPPVEEPTVVEFDGNRGEPHEETLNPLRVAGHAYVFSMDRLIEAQIRKGMDLYKASNGHYPKTHEEYMQKIIADGLIELPELESGYEYWYNPEEPFQIYQRSVGTDQAADESNEQ